MMKQKFRRGALRRWLTGLLCTGLLCQAVAVPAFAQTHLAEALTEGTLQAEETLEAENGWSISDLRAQFPEGRYWNHIGLSGNDPMATTSKPCTSHGSKGYNSNTCNHPTFGYYYGCWGYADQLGYLYSGSNPEKWTKLEGNSAYNYIDQLKTGDIIRFKFNSGAEHSVFVTSVSGNNVYYTDCNQGGQCDISWSRSKTKAYFRENNRVLWIQVCPGGEDTCSTAYAGWYRAKKGGANVNANHTTNWNAANPVGVIGEGQYVYVSKATGTGSGNLGHITYNGNERYIAMGLFTKMSGDPVGSLDSYGADAGSVWLNGWAFDWDDCNQQLTIEVCLDDKPIYYGTANTERADVNNTYSSVVGSYHGFSLRASTDMVGSHKMDVYAHNVGSGNNKCIGSVQVNIPAPAPSDKESPTLSDWKIYNITSEGFDVSVVSTDNVGVDRVIVKARTNDSDTVETRADRNGDTYTAHISIHDHGGVRGTYYVNVRSYDASGNYTYFITDQQVIVPEPSTDLVFNANGGTAEFETKPVEQGAAYGALPEAWMDGYVFDGWFTEQTGGDRVSSATIREKADGITLYAHWIPVAADPDKGWALQNGTLVISVQGAMQDYTSARETPWFKDRADIRRIVVQNGVTTIGDYAFYGCENVTSVSLPGTLTQIGRLSFYGCSSLAQIDVPASVTMLEDYAFARAVGLKKITFHGSAPVMGAGLFADVKAEVRYPSSDASWTSDVKRNYTGILDWSGVSVSELSLQDDSLQLEDPELEALLLDSTV